MRKKWKLTIPSENIAPASVVGTEGESVNIDPRKMADDFYKNGGREIQKEAEEKMLNNMNLVSGRKPEPDNNKNEFPVGFIGAGAPSYMDFFKHAEYTPPPNDYKEVLDKVIAAAQKIKMPLVWTFTKFEYDLFQKEMNKKSKK